MDEFYFSNIKGIRVEYPKSNKNMRWFAHYHLPVIRYWNPSLNLSVAHSKSLDMEPRIILDFDEQSGDTSKQQILRAHNFASDELFEQLMRVEKGANAQKLQDSLRGHAIEKKL